MQHKQAVLVSMILLASGLWGCTAVPGVSLVVQGSGEVVSEAREVGDFDAVQLASTGELRITQGESTALTVEADDNILPLIVTEVRGGTLVIDTKSNRIINTSREPIYTLTVTTLEGIGVSGSGAVVAGPLDSETLILDVSGSGSVQLERVATNEMNMQVSGSGNVNVDALTTQATSIDIGGSGDVTLAGETTSQAVNISGSGEYGSENLSSQTATVGISGSGGAMLRVAETLNVEINGAGDVRYYGDPRIESEVSGSGEVERVGE